MGSLNRHLIQLTLGHRDKGESKAELDFLSYFQIFLIFV